MFDHLQKNDFSPIRVWHSLVVRLVRDQETAGSNPVTRTKIGFESNSQSLFSLTTAMQILMADEINRQPSLNVKTAVLLINIHTNTCLFALALFPRQIYPQQCAIRIFRSVFRKQ